MDSTFEKLQELDLSRDEVNRIGEALKKPEFRKLLNDYVEEIQDPKNREIYEKEITQLEKERGNDITFIHPKPSYVIKTSVDGQKKAFINICVNDHVKKPTSSPTIKEGEKGLSWQLPHSLSPPREDLDNKRVCCKVFDVIFHSDTLHLAGKNRAFRDMVNKTALEAVENNFGVVLDKKNLKFPKLAYKGLSQASVIRTPSKDKPQHTPEDKEIMDKIFAAYAESPKPSPKKLYMSKKTNEDDKSKYTTPLFLIKHRSHVDMEECTEHRGAKLNAAIPKELIVEINLPLLKSSTDITLDVTEKTLQLICEKPAKYKLNLTLPYHVNEANGNAKFDKDKKKLVITLPVKRSASTVIDFIDSGVESDQCSPESPELEAESEKKLLQEIEPSEPSEQSDLLENSVECRTNFLEENLHYNLPEFTCHVFENTIAFTLSVKNVDDKSVQKIFLDAGSSVHVKFTSIGSAFYPSHYAFFVKFPSQKIDEDSASFEVWDNNVILQIPVSNDIPISSYFYGVNGENLSEKYVQEPEIINQIMEEVREGDESLSQKTIQETCLDDKLESENVSVIESQQNKQETGKPIFEKSVYPEQSRAIDIAGTSYESSGDELSCCSYSPSKNKGILKRISFNRLSVGRSISESSLDNFVSSSVENCYTSLDSVIPENGEISSSEKKTVRFSDVVMSQLFRSNSSILGQKKKNQRKARNKKRALERRHSESEASGDEKKDGENINCHFGNRNQFEKKDDHIFHLEVDN